MSILTESQRRRRAFFKRFRIYAIAAGTLLVLIGFATLVLKAPWWTEMSVMVRGGTPETHEEIIRDLKLEIMGVTRSAIFGPDHFYAWPEDFPYTASAAATISVEKKLWDKEIVFTITPREQYAVWCINQNEQAQCAWIDGAGMPFAKAPVAEGQLVRTIYASGSLSSIESDEPVVPNEIFAIIKTILDGLSQLEITVTDIEYKADVSELHVTDQYGTVILMSTRFDPTPTALPAVKRFIAKPGLNNLEYVNLTVENRAFVNYR